MSTISKKMLQAAAGAGGSPGAGNPWDISTAIYNASLAQFNVITQEDNPTDVFFKPDGTKMYVTGNTVPQAVHEYDLSTAWDISSANFLQEFTVATQESNPEGLFFKPDGTKMYVIGGALRVYEYDLSTAWDISSASSTANFSVSGQDLNPLAVFFRSDGLKMYITGQQGEDVNEYNLSTAWSISSASFVQNFSVSAQDSFPEGVSFKTDGTKMYVVGSDGDSIYEYDLSTAWNISTASLSQSFSVATQESIPQGLFFRSDGLKVFIVGSITENVYGYDLSTAWDISSAEFVLPTNDFFSVSTQDSTPWGIFFKPDGAKMYIVGLSGDSVYEYNLSSSWDIASASFFQSFNVAAQDSFPFGIFFRDDGLKMYVVGFDGKDINEYNLSTAWDISTASFLQSFSVSVQDDFPRDVFFKPDGTKMYVIGTSSDAVHEYNLSTAWNVSTASFLQSFSVASQHSFPFGIFFRDDGLKMYVVGAATDTVSEYDLSTAWNVSTASFLHDFSVADQDGAPRSLFFKPDGLKMFLTGNNGDAVYSYDL